MCSNHNSSLCFFQVLLWSVEEVASWVKKIGFPAAAFVEAGVDGDLLLQLDEKNLKEDLNMTNGIHRKRFLRELTGLRKAADYSSKDTSNMAGFLATAVGPDYKAYTYDLLRHDLSLELMKRVNEADLHDMLKEAGVKSAIHRLHIIEAVYESANTDDNGYVSQLSGGSSNNSDGVVDVYVSYPRRGGAELASLIKMNLQLRGFSVYADAHDSVSTNANVLNYVREAKNFVIILSPNALDECIGDLENKSQLHKEIVTALQNDCNIIPVIDDFQFPDPEELPENMRALCYFNGVRWVHDYQEACVDKLERFIRGESFVRTDSLSHLMSSTGRRSRADSGRSTPSKLSITPLVARKQRHRTFSCDSAISSNSS